MAEPSSSNPTTPDALLTRLEELSRWRQGAEGRYRDAIAALPRIKGATNHVVLGRRGSGKTRLLDELRRSSDGTHDHVVSVGAEDHKELTYPDILIQILRTFLREFADRLQPPRRWSGGWFGGIAQRMRHPLRAANAEKERANLTAEVSRLAHLLDDLLAQSEELDATYSTKESRAQEATDRTEAKVSAGRAVVGRDRQVATSTQEGVERTLSQRERKRVKVERQLPDFKHILTRVSRLLGGRIFLCVDDFYYIRKLDQPPVADYIHRIWKDTHAFLKVATIRHRSELYRHGDVTRGVVFGHEVQKIDLDLPLGQFDTVQHFLQGIWEEVCRETNTDPTQVFKGEGFAHAVLASGGVPRDFFGVTKYAANLAGTRGEATIGKLRVSEAAREADVIELQECINAVRPRLWEGRIWSGCPPTYFLGQHNGRGFFHLLSHCSAPFGLGVIGEGSGELSLASM